MSKFDLKLAGVPTKIRVALGDTGRYTEFDISDFDSDVMRLALVNGFMGALNNISRGYSDADKKVQNTDDAWAAAREKRVDAWRRGQWADKERGDSNLSIVKDQYYFETMAATGMSTKAIDKVVKDLVEKVFGKDTKATFDNYLSALSTEFHGKNPAEGAVAKTAGELETALRTRALERQEAAKKAADKIVMPDMNALLGIKAAAE